MRRIVLLLLCLTCGCAVTSPVVWVRSWEGSQWSVGRGVVTPGHTVTTVAHVAHGLVDIHTDTGRWVRVAEVARRPTSGEDLVVLRVPESYALPTPAYPDCARPGDSGTPLLVGGRVLGFLSREKGGRPLLVEAQNEN